MKYFFDTEFIENGPDQPIHLISLGMVCEDGREYYGVNLNCLFHLANDWVKKKVLPFIDYEKGVPRSQLKEEVQKFVSEGKEDPEFWSYYADYDWVVFCQLFGTMIDLPPKWPKYCRGLKQWADMVGFEKKQYPPDPENEHHALHDARWNKKLWELINDEIEGRKWDNYRE